MFSTKIIIGLLPEAYAFVDPIVDAVIYSNTRFINYNQA